MLWPPVHHSYRPVTLSSHASSFPSFIMWGCQLISAVTSAGHIYSVAVTHLHCESIIWLPSQLIRLRLCLRVLVAPEKPPVFAASSDSSASSAFRSQRTDFPPSPLPVSGLHGGIFQSRTPPRSQNLPEESKRQRLSDKTRDIAISAV